MTDLACCAPQTHSSDSWCLESHDRVGLPRGWLSLFLAPMSKILENVANMKRLEPPTLTPMEYGP